MSIEVSESFFGLKPRFFCANCCVLKNEFVVLVQKTEKQKLFKILLTIKNRNAIILATYRERKPAELSAAADALP